MQRSGPAALSKASALSSSGKHLPGSPTASTCSSPAWHNTAGFQSTPTSSLQSDSNSVDTPSSVITEAGSVAASASLQQGVESSTPSSGDGSGGSSASVDRSKAWARLASIKEEKPAMQQYRVAFNLMRLRDETRSCTGWTDDDSPCTADDSRTPFQSSRPGDACSSSENDRCAVVCIGCNYGGTEMWAICLGAVIRGGDPAWSAAPWLAPNHLEVYHYVWV